METMRGETLGPQENAYPAASDLLDGSQCGSILMRSVKFPQIRDGPVARPFVHSICR